MGPTLMAGGLAWNLGAHAETEFPHLIFSTLTSFSSSSAHIY